MRQEQYHHVGSRVRIAFGVSHGESCAGNRLAEEIWGKVHGYFFFFFTSAL